MSVIAAVVVAVSGVFMTSETLSLGTRWAMAAILILSVFFAFSATKTNAVKSSAAHEISWLPRIILITGYGFMICVFWLELISFVSSFLDTALGSLDTCWQDQFDADDVFTIFLQGGSMMKKKMNNLLYGIILTGFLTMSVAGMAAKTPDVLFRVIQNDLWGFIDVSGKMVIQPQYQSASNFSENRALVRTPEPDPQILCIDSSGKTVFKLSPDWIYMADYKEGLARLKDKNLNMYGYLDLNGNVAIPFKYSSAGAFHDGLASVEIKKDDKFQYGFINKKGETVIPMDGNMKFGFSDGMAEVRVWGKDGRAGFGYIDTTGKIVIEPKYRKVGSFSEGYAFVVDGEQLQIIGKDGFALANVPYKVNEFDKIPMFHEGFAAPVNSWRDGKAPWGFLNKIGKVVFPDLKIWAIRTEFSEGRAWVKLDGSNDTTLIDTNGKVIATIPDVSEVEPFQDGLSAMQINREKSITYYNREGKRVWPQ